MYSLILLEKAKLEWAEASYYYEIHKEGLGDTFSESLINKLNLIQKSPELYQKRVKEYREVIISPFPFLIIYRIEKTKKTVVIVSIFHTKRNPKNKLKIK